MLMMNGVLGDALLPPGGRPLMAQLLSTEDHVDHGGANAHVAATANSPSGLEASMADNANDNVPVASVLPTTPGGLAAVGWRPDLSNGANGPSEGAGSEDGGEDSIGKKTPRERLPNLSAEQIHWYMTLRMNRQSEVDGSSTTSTALWQDIARAFKERWNEERKWTSLAHRWDNELARFRDYRREVRQARERGASEAEVAQLARPPFASFFEEHAFQDRPEAKRGAPKDPNTKERKVAKRRLATPIPSKVTVASTSLALLVDDNAPSIAQMPLARADEALALGVTLVETAAASGADLVLLPELFPYCGVPLADAVHDVKTAGAHSKGAVCLARLKELARTHRMNVVTGALLVDVVVAESEAAAPGTPAAPTPPPATAVGLRNAALFLDRKGELVGEYWKRFPLQAEIEQGVLPGSTCVVVESDIGRVGLAVGFDLNFSQVFQEMTGKGVDFAAYLAPSDGGLTLQAEAMKLRKPVVSSVAAQGAKVVDGCGRVLTETSRWSRLLVHDICVQTEVFHTDGKALRSGVHWVSALGARCQPGKLLELQQKYGKQIKVEALSDENLFSISIQDNALKLTEVVTAHKLTTYDDYIAQCAVAVKKSLNGQTTASKHGNRKRPRHL